MEGIGKGIGIGITAAAIAFAAVKLNNPYVCWAFLVCAGMAYDWRTEEKEEKDEEEEE